MSSSAQIQPTECSSVAEELFKLLLPHRKTDGLEVEIRLCRFADDKIKTSGVSDDQSIRIVKGKVEAGVSEADYTRMVAHCKSIGDSVSHTVTRDVVDGKWRYTYTTEHKPPRCIARVRKQRLILREIAVPSAAYNLRFSVSTETSGPLPCPVTQARKGYMRLKDRQSVKSGLYCYDATRVGAGGAASYEMEIEGVFTDPEVELTESWVKGLIERAVAMARLPLQDDSDEDSARPLKRRQV